MDGSYIRLALLSAIPVFLLFGIFFMIVVFGNLFQVFGPTKNIATNTRYHSAIKPNLSSAYYSGFFPPRITIQMRVYTESLQAVIILTITSLKAAISHYELYGSKCPGKNGHILAATKTWFPTTNGSYPPFHTHIPG